MPVSPLIPEPKRQFFTNNGIPASGYKLFIYDAGTTTKATTFTESNGLVANANPIILNSRGEPGNGVYVGPGAYKVVLAPDTDTDPPTSPVWTRDNLFPLSSGGFLQHQTLTAIAGQTVFTFTTISYTPGINSLSIFINGLRQRLTVDYTETSTTSITMTYPLQAGDEVTGVVQVANGLAGTIDAANVSNGGNLNVIATGSTTARSLANRWADVANVKDFGVKGDGVTDDTAAIAAAYTVNDVLFWPEGTYLCSISLTRTNTPIAIIGEGPDKTIIRNNSASSIGISLTDCWYSILRDFTFDNNNVANDGIKLLRCNQSKVENLHIKNHGNPTVQAKYGINLDSSTLSDLSSLVFFDITSAEGQHLRISQSFYSVFTNINAASGGTSNNNPAIRIDAAVGLSFHGLYCEPSGLAAMWITSSENINFYSLSIETGFGRDLTGSAGVIRIITCKNVNINGLRFFQAALTGSVVPFIQVQETNGLTIDNAMFKRYVNTGSVMVNVSNGNSSVNISNVFLLNANQLVSPSPVAFDFIDVGGNTLSGFSLKNIEQNLGTPTHKIGNASNVVIENVDGTLVTTGASVVQRYEEGSWALVPNANLTISAVTANATYTRVGNLVTIIVFFSVNTVSGTDNVTISLPFTSGPGVASNFNFATAMCYTNGVDTGTTGLAVRIDENATSAIFIQTNDNAAAAQLTNASLAPNDDIAFTITYMAVP